MFFEIAFIAYLIDRIFGEFKFIRHPVVLMGDFITYYEKRFYTNTVWGGVWIVFWLLLSVFALVYPLTLIDNKLLLAVIASTGIASKMLYESVGDVLLHPENIRYLVSRDTQNLSESEINKAAIETYAENLSDGVIAPLLYLLFFGVVGLFVYKAISTLDSMVGYRSERYEKFGKASAYLDDILNYLPSRITAVLILILFGKLTKLKKTWAYGTLHDSPNAGYPISAMALSLNLSLGGATQYFGVMKPKANFGEGRTNITTDDVRRALSLQMRVDILVIALLILGVIL